MKCFSIENPGACPRHARDGWVGTSWSVVPLDLHPCHYLLSWELRVGEKKRKTKCLKQLSERVDGWWHEEDDNLSCATLPCLHKDRVLRLRFASPQNLDKVINFYVFLLMGALFETKKGHKQNTGRSIRVEGAFTDS